MGQNERSQSNRGNLRVELKVAAIQRCPQCRLRFSKVSHLANVGKAKLPCLQKLVELPFKPMLTETEINFYRHYNWECLTFVNGPAKQWLKKHEISDFDFSSIFRRMQKPEVYSFLFEEPLIEPPLEYPWKDAVEFWIRYRELSDML